jgi:hypothetical protein
MDVNTVLEGTLSPGLSTKICSADRACIGAAVY